MRNTPLTSVANVSCNFACIINVLSSGGNPVKSSEM